MTPGYDPAQSATTFFFAPADGRVWGLSGERFATAFRQRWKDGSVSDVGDDAPPKTSMTFWLREAGRRCQGLFVTGSDTVPELFHLEMCTPDEAMVVLPWFLGLIPADAKVRFNSMDGAELGYADRDFWIPRGMGQAPMLTALAEHLVQVLTDTDPPGPPS